MSDPRPPLLPSSSLRPSHWSCLCVLAFPAKRENNIYIYIKCVNLNKKNVAHYTNCMICYISCYCTSHLFNFKNLRGKLEKQSQAEYSMFTNLPAPFKSTMVASLTVVCCSFSWVTMAGSSLLLAISSLNTCSLYLVIISSNADWCSSNDVRNSAGTIKRELVWLGDDDDNYLFPHAHLKSGSKSSLSEK